MHKYEKIDSNIKSKIIKKFFNMVDESDKDENFLFTFTPIVKDNNTIGWKLYTYNNSHKPYETEYLANFDLKGFLLNDGNMNFFSNKSFVNSEMVHYYIKEYKYKEDLTFVKDGTYFKNKTYALGKNNIKQPIKEKIFDRIRDHKEESISYIVNENKINVKINIFSDRRNVLEINSFYNDNEDLISTGIKQRDSFDLFKYITSNEMTLNIPVLHKNKEFIATMSATLSSTPELDIYYYSPVSSKTYNIFNEQDNEMGENYFHITKKDENSIPYVVGLSMNDKVNTFNSSSTYSLYYTFYNLNLCISEIRTPVLNSAYLIDKKIPSNLYERFKNTIIKDLKIRSDMIDNSTESEKTSLLNIDKLSTIMNNTFEYKELIKILNLDTLSKIVNFSQGLDIVNDLNNKKLLPLVNLKKNKI